MTQKPVVFRGGIASFTIPETWREEYAPDGGGTFYEDKPDTGTLRLNVISLEKNRPMTLEAAIGEIFAGSGHESLPMGFPMRRYVKEAEERGTTLHLHRWEILVPVLPNRWRLICFTHTVLAAHEKNPATQAELQLVDDIVRNADYSTVPGILPKKSWWKLW